MSTNDPKSPPSVYDPDFPGGRPLRPGETMPGTGARKTAGRKKIRSGAAGDVKSGKDELTATPEEFELVKKLAESHPRLPRIVFSSGQIGFEGISDVTGIAKWLEALGTFSVDFFLEIVRDCKRTCCSKGQIDEYRFNAMMAFVASIKPRDHVEVALAVQMAMAHRAAMQAMGDLTMAELQMQAENAERVAARFMRIYAMQMEALKKYRASQAVVAVQNVSVSEGAQAVVANGVQVSGEHSGSVN